jgi:hypothetical protein
MSQGVQDQKSQQTRNRLSLAAAVDSSGFLAEMPCTRCFRQNKVCRIGNKSSRCSECIRAGRSCDGTAVASSLTRLLTQQKKLEVEEVEAEEALFVLQTQLATAVNRLARLRRMKKVLREKSSETFRRGMQELDAEDGVVSVDLQEQRVVGDIQSFGVSGDVDWASLGLGDDFGSLGPLVEDEVPRVEELGEEVQAS